MRQTILKKVETRDINLVAKSLNELIEKKSLKGMKGRELI